MEIINFLELYSGQWFSQRTHYNMAGSEVENAKADLTIELLLPENPLIAEICQDSLLGVKTSWDTSVDWAVSKQIGSSLLVFAKDGRLFAQTQKSSFLKGSYRLENQETLILSVKNDTQEIEERIWFPNSNFRLRTSVVKQGLPQSSFYSEIRKLPPKQG